MMLATLRLVAYAVVSLLGMPIQAVAVLFHSPAAVRIPLYYHRVCLRLFGIRVQVEGAPSAHRPCLYVANHSSYLDIPVLGALIPGCFVAKSEVKRWPLFGWLARLQRTLFIDRRPSCVTESQAALIRRLSQKDNMILFPEGTSSDGVRVLPFRRALLQPLLDQAAGTPLTLQPVSVTCVALNGLPADRVARQFYAWFGDMDLLPHLWRFVHTRSCTVRVTFHPPLTPEATRGGKEFTEKVEHTVAAGILAGQGA